MQGFPVTTLRNIGGMKQFNFIPNEHVGSLPFYTGKLIESAVTPLGGKTWFTGYSTFQKLLWREEEQLSEHGNFYQQTLSGFVPWHDDELQELMEEMSGYRHIIDAYNNNGKRILAGTIENGLRFSATFDSGAVPGVVKGYAFRFFTESGERVPFYEP